MKKGKRVVFVSGYSRGKKRVKSHKRTKPDGIKCNNHSYRGSC
ncbi:hypothetical protein QMO72_14000 (plasmid) [Staphylococcus casei]|nr:hypothetical protein [Staphylococcus casei]WJE87813.1 hypothetical protein QMO72_14000 [Staphylococcus casei]